MGLDMFARTTKRRLNSPVDFTTNDADTELYCWRKHPNLHGWMEQLYRLNGGSDAFNCTTVQLTEDDIDRLEQVIRDGKLPETSGFFFGMSDGSECEDDLDFIAKARAAIAKGFSVYYYAWW